jgi:hypothetical protein
MIGLGTFFALLYFVQEIVEPTDGLLLFCDAGKADSAELRAIAAA